MMTTEEKIGFCTLCRSRCGSINVVENDCLVSVRPAPHHPTGQALCTKGKAAPELVHSPRRILHPMRRTRPKGEADPGWERISWDEALNEVAQRLDRIRQENGAESVAFGVSTPSGTPLCDSIDWIERFIRLFGSPNICYGTEICNWHKDFAHMFTFGCGMPTADYAHSDLIILWGHNPANVWLSQATAISEGRARGAKMIVVDPRRTALAAQADHWLRVRPGTDAALALGLSHLLLAENGFDESFVRNWTNAPLLVRDDNGHFLREADLDPQATHNRFLVWHQAEQRAVVYDPSVDSTTAAAGHIALSGRYEVGAIACRPAFQHFADACASYTPEYVASITWIPKADIRAAARTIMTARSVAYHAWTGVGQHSNASQTERAIATLYALTGSFDIKGGNVAWNRQPVNRVNTHDLLPEAQRAKALGLDRRPLGPPAQGWITARDLYDAIIDAKPYRIRAMMAFGTNSVLSQGDTERARQAFEQLEFHVHCDLFETPTSSYADILLPINSPWEREGLRIGFEIDENAEELVQLRQRMVSPRGASRSDNDIVFDLAVRLGMADAFFGGQLEAGWNHILAPLGLDVEMLRRQPEGIRCPLEQSYRKYADQTVTGVRGFATETRRVELYSEKLLRHGYPAVPVFDEPADSPASETRFPYVLSSAKTGYYCHSQHRGLASLRKRAPVPVVEMHPQLAADKGIYEGDWSVISTRAGQARFQAKFNDALHPDVLVAEYGWWQACEDLGQPGYPATGPQTSNFNALINADHADPLSGSVPHRSSMCDIAPDPSVKPARRRWSGFRPFRVVDLHAEAGNVMSVTFAAVDGGPLPDYQPGQHLQVRIGAIPGQGEVTRSYSLTGYAVEFNRETYRIAVKGVPEGVMSSHIVRSLQHDGVVDLKAPSGNFVMPLHTSLPVVLIAGGIGITPFISYLESLAGRADAPKITLHYATQNSSTHAFKARLEALEREIPTLTVVIYYSRPLAQDRIAIDYDVPGRISGSAITIEEIVQRARFYLCGPAPMTEQVTEALVARGVPKFDIFKEVFRSPFSPVPVTDQIFSVYFARSERRTTWRSADGSLLELGEALGITMPSGCRVGQCESCSVGVTAGQVQHLTPVDGIEDDRCLACQAIPCSDLVLDI
jgi:anaerobic selenocysteine-containing dehydrogenase/ferredoxin-NADP reductase